MLASSLFLFCLLTFFLLSFLGGLRRWYNPPWFSEIVPATPYNPLVLREAFEKACDLSLVLCSIGILYVASYISDMLMHDICFLTITLLFFRASMMLFMPLLRHYLFSSVDIFSAMEHGLL